MSSDTKTPPTQLTYQEVVRSKIIVEKEGCKLNEQHFYIRHRSFQELVEFIQAMHEVSYCKCGANWPFFTTYPYKVGEGLVFK